uniref:mannan endo-1,4-beta-mannosidase n=1 Tax=Zea mays TaxID=4577 RepID=A0A804NXG7_MAIZE
MAKSRREISFGLAVVLSLTAAALVRTGHGADAAFARASGTRFTIGGRPFYSNGFNAYWLMYMASDPADRSKATAALDEAARLGATLVRTWAFSDGGYRALQVSPGVYDEEVFRGLDYVISEAKKRGIHLILSLVNNWDGYGGKKQYVQWARTQGHSLNSDDDFFTDSVTKGFYKNHVKALLTRVNKMTGVAYKDEPAIFAWELMNEPRCQSDLSGKTLQAWITEMASYVKSVDPNHTVEIGLEGFYGDRVHARPQAPVQPGRVHRRHRLHLQQPDPRRRLRHDPLLPRPMGARRERRRAGGVHAAVDGVARRRRRGGAAEAAAGGGVRLVRALQQLHGVHAGRLLPHGVRGDLRVGESGRAARGGPLLAGHGARDGELDRRLRRRARP